MAEELPHLKELILETREREARLAAEEALRQAEEEEAVFAAASFEHHRHAGRRRA